MVYPISSSSSLLLRSSSPEDVQQMLEDIQKRLQVLYDSPNPLIDEVQLLLNQIDVLVRQLNVSSEVKPNLAPIGKLAESTASRFEQMAGRAKGPEAEEYISMRDQMDQVRSWIERFQGACIQSEIPSDIDWKIHKYEAIINSLKMGLGTILDSSNPCDEEIQDEFVILTPTTNPKAVGRLYALLKSVQPGPYNQEYLNSIRYTVEDFLLLLRELIQACHDDQLLLAVCNHLFTKINLDAVADSIIEKLDALGKLYRQDAKLKTFPESLLELYENLAAVPYSAKAPLLNQFCNSARGRWNVDFDPALQGNPTHILYQLKFKEKNVISVGMGNPTHEGIGCGARINPEFEGLLKYFQSNQKRFLFISNQNYQSEVPYVSWLVGGNETARLRTILEQMPKKYAGTFYSVAFSKNSIFYHQSAQYEDLNKATSFMAALVWEKIHAKPKDSGNYIPETVRARIPNFEEEVGFIVKAIYRELFDESVTLSREQRRLFIDIFDECMSKFLMKHLQIDAFTICCKDGIDRGAESNTIFFANSLVAAGFVIDINYQKKIASLMFARALMVRKRPPFKEKVERLVDVLKFNLSNPLRLQKLAAALDLAFVPCI